MGRHPRERHLWISLLFAAGALYDGLLGAVFLLFPLALFERYGVTYPNHVGYVQFPALLLIIFAWMFVDIARDPAGNHRLMPYGVLLKGAYAGVVFWYWFGPGIPGMWKPFAVIDAVMGALFIASYVYLGGGGSGRE